MADDSEAARTAHHGVEMEQQPSATQPSPHPSADVDSSIPPSSNPPIISSTAAVPPASSMDAGTDEVTPPPAAVIQEREAKPGSLPETFAPITITLLSSMSGTRTNFTMDSEYLQRHNLDVSEPLLMSAYNLKECIWRDWKEDEMDKRPTGAHLIRLIFFGRLLEDRSYLRDYRFQPDSANVIHLSLKPSESGNDDDATTRSGKGFGAHLGRRSGTPTCRCVIL